MMTVPRHNLLDALFLAKVFLGGELDLQAIGPRDLWHWRGLVRSTVWSQKSNH